MDPSHNINPEKFILRWFSRYLNEVSVKCRQRAGWPDLTLIEFNPEKFSNRKKYSTLKNFNP